MHSLKTFARSDDGAVTVDWTILSAATIGLGIITFGAVSNGTTSLGATIQAALSSAWISGRSIASLSFDDVTGLTETGWGWRARNAYGGWNAVSDVQNIEIVTSGYNGVNSPDGGNMLDMDASPGNLGIGRVMENLAAGATHTVTFNAADAQGTNGVDVYFGGELVGSANPGGRTMESYSFEFVAGSGDGSNELVLQGTGPANNVGAYIHGIQVN